MSKIIVVEKEGKRIGFTDDNIYYIEKDKYSPFFEQFDKLPKLLQKHMKENKDKLFEINKLKTAEKKKDAYIKLLMKKNPKLNCVISTGLI